MADWEIVIGLEIHVELQTDSKVFCGCSTQFGGETNTRVCPVCMGLPGSLPVLNEKAVEYAAMAGLALNSEIASYSKFDRKNYFYPDLPKAYQVSQYDLPLCRGGFMEIGEGEKRRRIAITRVHMEEETGKSLHSGETIIGSQYSLLDYNRAGIPLIEIVTEPDMRSPAEAREFLEKLKVVIQYTGISDCKMEEGSLRCDANISIRPMGSERLGTKTEVKNMNSFRAVERALAYEAERQKDLLESGERVLQETRHWDESRGITLSMRSKEQAHDYRYFPEPDLVPMVLDAAWVATVWSRLPELPSAKRLRFIEQYGLPEYDAGVLTTSRPLADFYEEVVAAFPQPKVVSNWVMGELMRLLKGVGREINVFEDIGVEPSRLAELLRMVEAGTINAAAAKEVFEEMFRTGGSPAVIVKAKGLEQISDTQELVRVIRTVLEQHQDAVESYRAGKEKALGRIVGEVMKQTRGKANPQIVNEILRTELGPPGQA